MEIVKKKEDTKLTIALEGRLDTKTAPRLESEIQSSLAGITKLTFELAGLEYVSSAGLRVILSAQKIMNKQGEMIVVNANETVMEVFEVTGFVEILDIM